jgi:hypothetical protein
VLPCFRLVATTVALYTGSWHVFLEHNFHQCLCTHVHLTYMQHGSALVTTYLESDGYAATSQHRHPPI